MADTIINRFDLRLDDERSMALAQLVKRLRWEHMRECAVNDDEAYAIRDAVEKLQAALADGGFKPR